MKRITIFILLIATFFYFPTVRAAGSGDYKLIENQVTLVPYSDGTTDIVYHQKWQVISGHRSSIKVGLPNNDYELQDKNNGDIKSIVKANGDGWSGVEAQLSRDFQAGESFQFGFTVKQIKLFWADENNYHLDFTPGWYDNAETEKLVLTVKFFAKMETIIANPKPDKTTGNEMVWEKKLHKAEQWEIKIDIPKNLFPTPIDQKNLQSSTADIVKIIVIIIIIIAIIIILMIIIDYGTRRGGYSGGGIFFGDDGIVTAIADGLSSGGGGGFGGGGSSCAGGCACACACACAGGGSGCERHMTHLCPLCEHLIKKGE